jgi:hypothetical protein
VVETAPPGIRTVAVPPFETRAPEPELGALVAAALQREIAAGTALRLASPGEADAVVRGTVEAVDDVPGAFRTRSGAPVASAWTTSARASAVLEPGGSAIGPVEARAQRAGGAVAADDLAARDRAMRGLAADLASRLYRELVGR